MMEAIRSSEMSVLTKNTRRKIPEDGFLYIRVAHKFAGPEKGRLFRRACASSNVGLPLRSLSGESRV
jgi:hypothetical protein